ncbi:MAG: peptidoglycan editing factor PgeF [Bdellovibrionota bacterium]
MHGFGTRTEPVPIPFMEMWPRKPLCKQVHGCNTVEVFSPAYDCGEADGFYTGGVNIPLSIATADCVPILLARKSGERIAAVHAGWRGTKSRILRALWEKLIRIGEDPSQWCAAVGPAIGPCCYEVSAELAAAFEAEFSEAGTGVAVPKPRTLDLQAINVFELKAIGLGQVDLIRACTKCSGESENPTFFSYRENPRLAKRQYSVIARTVAASSGIPYL